MPKASKTGALVARSALRLGWTRKDNSELSMVVLESEDAAQGASERIPSGIPDAVTLEGVEVREVVEHA
jgi:hypothetical protein